VENLLSQLKKKLHIIKRYLALALLLGFVLGLISVSSISLFLGDVFRISDLLIMWVAWFAVLSVVLPAVLNDEFTSPTTK
jgi:Mg/Co/Ni transporter MgtE